MLELKMYKLIMKYSKNCRLRRLNKVVLYILTIFLSTILIKTQLIILGRTNKQPGMKYVLLWTNKNSTPFAFMGEGQNGFISRNCPFTNCFVTGNKSLLGSYTKFDAVVFSGPDIVDISLNALPLYRRRNQKYVFASIESPINYPICNSDFDGYFNWTWTYKLGSDIQWGYLVIRDSDYNIVGPRKDMHWIPFLQMQPVSKEFKIKLKSKRLAVAWFVSNCRSSSRREGFARNLQNAMSKYNITIDVYGNCGTHICPRSQQDTCNKIIAKDYYFYLSFENAFSEDYVTEKLLIPLQNDAVPIVYGGANYTRFLSPGSYLNARELGPPILAERIYKLMNEPDRYADMFKWKNHYSYHRTVDSIETNEYCKMCEALNDETAVRSISILHDFGEWWEPSCGQTTDFKSLRYK